MPFTVSLEPGKLTSPVAAYLRIAPKGSTGLPAPAAGEKAPAYPFEDVYFTELRSAGPGQPARLTRAFAVAPGTYDVYVALRERPATGAATDAPVKVALLKQEVVVPNYHTDELQTSSVLVADKIEPLTAPIAPEAMKERPYVLGDSEITPAADLKFKKSEELQLVFQIYGAKLGADTKKPDVSVDYVFFQKDATRREDVQPDADADARRQVAAEELRSGDGAPVDDGPGRAAPELSRGRLPARDQDHRQQGPEERDARRALHRRSRHPERPGQSACRTAGNVCETNTGRPMRRLPNALTPADRPADGRRGRSRARVPREASRRAAAPFDTHFDTRLDSLRPRPSR